jgi:hypothetical protein
MVKRAIISLVIVIAIFTAIVSVTSLARRPVLGASLARPQGRLVARVHAPDRVAQPLGRECLSSTAFIDYTSDARGKATPIAAVRSYWPGAGSLRIQVLEPGRAVVEEFNGAIKVGVYELFHMGKGWLVVRADSYGPCESVG